jgi:hypothetical protein
MTHDSERYWIAINGTSCATFSLPLRNPLVTPTPSQLLGFPTSEEALHAQRICLEAPMHEVRAFFKSLSPDVKAGRIRVIRPPHPQPPTRGRCGSTIRKYIKSSRIHSSKQLRTKKHLPPHHRPSPPQEIIMMPKASRLSKLALIAAPAPYRRVPASACSIPACSGHSVGRSPS